MNYKKNEHLSKIEYDALFSGTGSNEVLATKKSAALERAWKNRDFEIDKYWSRATYFWAFIAATFAGFIAVNAAKDMEDELKINVSFVIICLGIIFSTAWVLVNKGSKQWQENWEKHIDMLENDITGPIYKTVLNKRSYSVSTINLLVSEFVLLMWVLLALKQIWVEFQDQSNHCFIVLALLLVIIWIIRMVFYGRTKSKNKRKMFSFHIRGIEYDEPK